MSMETRDHPAAAQAAGGVTPEETVSPADNEMPDGTERTETTAEAVPSATGTAVPDSAAGADVLPEASAPDRPDAEKPDAEQPDAADLSDTTPDSAHAEAAAPEDGASADDVPGATASPSAGAPVAGSPGGLFCRSYGRMLVRWVLVLCLTLWPLSCWWLAESGDAALDAVVARQAAGDFVLFGSVLAQCPMAVPAPGGSPAADGVLLYKLRLYEAVRPDVAVLGSWRMARFNGDVFSRPFVNMGGAVHGLADLRFVVDALVRGHRPQVVIIGADFWWFVPQREAVPLWRQEPQDPFGYGPSRLRRLWAAVLSGEVPPLPALHLLTGGRDGRYGLLAQVYGEGFGPDGAWRDVAIPTGVRPSADRGFAATLARAREGRGEFAPVAALDAEAVETFAEIICRLRARGIQTLVVLPPVAAPVLDMLRAQESRWPQLFALRQALLDRGVDVMDFTDPRRFGSGDCEMLDGLHAGGVAALRMLREMTDRHQVLLNYVDMAQINHALLNWKRHVFVRDPRVSPVPEVDFLHLSCPRKS